MIKVPSELVRRYREALAEMRAVEEAVSNSIMEQMPFKKGDIVRDPDTGALYRVDGGSGFLHGGNLAASASLRLYRVYKTGRREARSLTYRSHDRLELSSL